MPIGAARQLGIVRRSGLGLGRVHLSVRSLLNDPVRLVISLGGLAFAVLLVLLLRGIMDGTVEKSTAYVDRAGADVFVARGGVANMALASSSIPDTTVGTLGDVPGVDLASGIVRINVMASANGVPQPAVLIGYDPAVGLGGPWKLAEGRGVEAADDTVLDRLVASQLGVKVGSRVEIAGQSFTVVGLSSETAAIAGKLAFIRLDTAQGIIRAPGFVSFVLLKLHEGTNAQSFAENLQAAQPSLHILTRPELSANDRHVLGDLFVQPINVMSTVGFLVGLAIVGLTMYTTTAERLRDFGVLKAIGASNSYLLRTVVVQALLLGIAGFTLGLAAVRLSGPVIVHFVPDIGVKVEFVPAVQSLLAVLAMSLVGAMLPVARIVRVDPLVVFRR